MNFSGEHLTASFTMGLTVTAILLDLLKHCHFLDPPRGREWPVKINKIVESDEISILGTIHILRKHFYSTKLNLTSESFHKNWIFSSKQKNFFFNITF